MPSAPAAANIAWTPAPAATKDGAEVRASAPVIGCHDDSVPVWAAAASANSRRPLTATSTMQSSIAPGSVTPRAVQTARAALRFAGDSDAGSTGRSGIPRRVNDAVVSPGS